MVQVQCSDGQAREVSESVVTALVERAERAGVQCEDLDEAVHDCFDASASRRVNSDPDLPEDIEAAQDIAYGEAGRAGAKVNNAGLHAQVALLLAELGERETGQIIDRAAG